MVSLGDLEIRVRNHSLYMIYCASRALGGTQRVQEEVSPISVKVL